MASAGGGRSRQVRVHGRVTAPLRRLERKRWPEHAHKTHLVTMAGEATAGHFHCRPRQAILAGADVHSGPHCGMASNLDLDLHVAMQGTDHLAGAMASRSSVKLRSTSGVASPSRTQTNGSPFLDERADLLIACAYLNLGGKAMAGGHFSAIPTCEPCCEMAEDDTKLRKETDKLQCGIAADAIYIDAGVLDSSILVVKTF
jgi:hypothetical protein